MLQVRNATVRLIDAEGTGRTTAPRYAIDRVCCQIAPGELVGFVGLNGSGKSTLARLMCGAQTPDEGLVSVDGITSATADGQRRIRRLVGRLGQAPADQIISTVVADEVAFGLENFGLDELKINDRTQRALAAAGLTGFEDRAIAELSGGEQQRLAFASVLAMEPAYLVLDEPTSQLDSSARGSFRALVRRVARSGAGVALITHDPLEALMCDRVYCLRDGRIAWEATPTELLALEDHRLAGVLPHAAYLNALRAACAGGYDMKQGVEPHALTSWLAGECDANGTGAETLRALVQAMHTRSGESGAEPSARSRTAQDTNASAKGQTGIRIAQACVSRGGSEVLHDVSLAVPAGSVTLVAGASGAGKTTLACAVAGLVDVQTGTIVVNGEAPAPGRVAIAFQDPEDQLFLETVGAELAFAPRNLDFDEARVQEEVARAAGLLGIEELLERDPFALSGGQARRVALASILTAAPRALVLDEPTAGLDAPGRSALHRLVRNLAASGMPIIVISHDLEEWLDTCDRVALMRAGSIVWEGEPTSLEEDLSAFERAGIDPPESYELARACKELLRAPREGTAEDAAAVPPRASAARAPSVATPVRESAPVSTPLACLDARVKVILLLAATIAVFASGALWGLAVWLLCALAVARLSGMHAGATLHSLKPMLVLFFIVVAVNFVSLDGTAEIMVAAPVGFSPAGAARAVTAIARIVVLVLLALSVSASTTPTQLADAFVRLMTPLATFGVPVGDIGLTLSMALRFIPLVSSEAERIRRAQAARGVDFEGGSVMRRVRAWAFVITPLVVGLFRRADRIAQSMDARCFEPEVRRARPRALAARDVCVLVAGICAMVVLVVASQVW